MDLRPLIPVGWLLAGVIALALTVVWLQRYGSIPARAKPKRGGGHGLLTLQEFIEPSVEYIIQAQNTEQKREDDGDPLEENREALLADLAESLRHDPVDHEEVRRHLAALERSGADWRAQLEQALRAELAARPYRAPALPPVWRVAPAPSSTRQERQDERS
jgi:hypothetical protein